jgi:hypothetical protein
MLQTPSRWTDQRVDSAGAGALDAIPDIFCWTKMGTEAGQSLAAILHRKELERSAGGGTFAWGIGNSLGEAPNLARQMSPSGDVDVLFTPMKSAPKAVDVAPTQLLLWVYYQGRSGSRATLPEHMLVTSRGGADKRTHYALLCQSDGPLEERHDFGAFDSSGVRNLVSMNPVGSSQVTSVVRYSGPRANAESAYRVAFKARLYAEGFVKLVEPVPLGAELKALYEKVCAARTKDAWCAGVRKLKGAALALRRDQEYQEELLFA